MGCGDSRLPITSEEALIQHEESKLRLSSVPASFLSATIKKYSRYDQVTNSQLLRIIERLNLNENDPQSYKTKFFNQLFANLQPTGIGREKLTVWGVMFCGGNNSEKVKELFFVKNSDLSGRIDKQQVEEIVALMFAISTIYSPNLVKSDSASLADLKRILQCKSDSVSLAVVDSIVGSSASVTLQRLQDRFNSPMLSKFLTTAGIRNAVLEFKTGLETLTQKGKAGSLPITREDTAMRERTTRLGCYE